MLLPEYDVIGFDYSSQTPWDAAREFPPFFDDVAGQHSDVSILGNSIGAFFAMTALCDKQIKNALLISPLVDMEGLILSFMAASGVSEEALRREREITTDFGETLSWKYLEHVRRHPLRWTVTTHILYGGNDGLTSRDTITAFAERIGATLTILEDGEHWFHTPEQLAFLDHWLQKHLQE